MNKFSIENFKIKREFRIVIETVLWLFVALAIVMTLIVNIKQSNPDGFFTINNKSYIVVEDDSMSGKNGLNPGDVMVVQLLSRQEKNNNLNHGDVISFFIKSSDGSYKKLFTQRIFEILVDVRGTKSYVTRSDNSTDMNDYDLAEIEDIYGKWNGEKIPFIGKPIRFLQTNTGFTFFIAIPLFIFFAYELLLLIITLRQTKNRRSISTIGIKKHNDYDLLNTNHRQLSTHSTSSLLSSYNSSSKSTTPKKRTTKPSTRKSTKTKSTTKKKTSTKRRTK